MRQVFTNCFSFYRLLYPSSTITTLGSMNNNSPTLGLLNNSSMGTRARRPGMYHTCTINTIVAETRWSRLVLQRPKESRCAGAARSRSLARSHLFRVRATWLMAGPRRRRAAASSPVNLTPYASSVRSLTRTPLTAPQRKAGDALQHRFHQDECGLKCAPFRPSLMPFP